MSVIFQILQGAAVSETLTRQTLRSFVSASIVLAGTEHTDEARPTPVNRSPLGSPPLRK